MILKPMGIPGVCPAHLRAWTAEEDELLINLHNVMTAKEITSLLPKRTFSAISRRIFILRQLYPDRVSYIKRPYTPKEDKFIRDNYQTMTAKEIAGYLNRSWKSVAVRARDGLGISFYKCGERHPNSKYPDDLTIRVQEWRDEFNLSFGEIDRRLGTPKTTARHLYSRPTADYAIARGYLPR
ncbi:SANT/Myb domain-containing protein [Salmonella enterica]|nr:SANT/Myb domain-containing protein [Salmonella enterica]